MKLLFVSSLLLLLSLASAGRTPYATMLFEDNYVISEGKDPREISLNYDKDVLETHFNNRETEGSDSMDFKRDLVNGSVGFAIEAYSPSSDVRREDCLKNSDEQLRPLIHRCFGYLKVRLLTAEEKEKLRAYKEEQKVSKKRFEVIYRQKEPYDPNRWYYNGKQITIKSAQVDHIWLGDYLSDFYYHHIQFGVELKKRQDWNYIDFEHKLEKDNFVIESLPAESNEKCGVTGMNGLDLKFSHCYGKVQLKHNGKVKEVRRRW